MPAAGRLALTSIDELISVLAETASEASRLGRPSAQALAALRRSTAVGAVAPTEYGGQGLSATGANRLIERIARVDASTAIMLFQHLAVTARIIDWGTPAQREHYLPRLADGSCLAASAWSETGAGADKRRLSTTATRTRDGWLLNGAKAFTTGAGSADVYLVLARSGAAGDSDTTYGASGQSFFLVEADNPGLVPDTSLDLVGMRSSATGFVDLTDCLVDADASLGPLGEAPKIIASVRESGATLGAVSVGLAQAAYDLAYRHAVQGGLLAHQAVRHRLVELGVRVDAARAMVEWAGSRAAEDPGVTTLRSKIFASGVCVEICRQAQEFLGSAGFVRDHPINRISADARAVSLMGPTNDLCRELVSAPWTN